MKLDDESHNVGHKRPLGYELKDTVDDSKSETQLLTGKS
jgi:hypothetical protein